MEFGNQPAQVTAVSEPVVPASNQDKACDGEKPPGESSKLARLLQTAGLTASSRFFACRRFAAITCLPNPKSQASQPG
jgi:hypothetical protein